MTETFRNIQAGEDCITLLPDGFTFVSIDCSTPGICRVSFGDDNHTFATHDIKLTTNPNPSLS